MQNFIVLICLSAFPIKWIANGYRYSGTHVDDVALMLFFAVSLIYFVFINIRSAEGISVLIASAVTVFGFYFGALPQNTWFEASLFLSVWILVPKILPAIVRSMFWVVSMALSKKTHA
ncbi:hypothetical protein GIV75_28840 [Pseudomonas sp. PA-3-5D]|uniref:hypothetical protein n=1 Tax=unclassified Pseudomonas TaxID=196821 RepID=UPI001F3C46DB|nr:MULTISPECIES: hypothetical protein [unclassified Pseudomonas]MCF5511803.1 hypothetical protein [Pseudomonas sp. PA-3-6H]MCF5564843.1 hypothetical protein [Pseudomonas sp. PA-3-5D]